MSVAATREHVSQQRLTDEDLRDILFWRADEPCEVLAREMNVTAHTVRAMRKLKSFRALRIATEFGLINRSAPRLFFAPDRRSTRKVRAGQIAVAASRGQKSPPTHFTVYQDT
jgi:hypothetical protein